MINDLNFCRGSWVHKMKADWWSGPVVTTVQMYLTVMSFSGANMLTGKLELMNEIHSFNSLNLQIGNIWKPQITFILLLSADTVCLKVISLVFLLQYVVFQNQYKHGWNSNVLYPYLRILCIVLSTQTLIINRLKNTVIFLLTAHFPGTTYWRFLSITWEHEHNI